MGPRFIPIGPSWSIFVRSFYLQTFDLVRWNYRFGVCLDTAGRGKVYFEVRLLVPKIQLFLTPQAALAQLVEHSIRNRKVVGSTPMGGSIYIQ